MKQKKTYCFFELFEKFILESKKGRRLQPNGKRISVGTIANYQACLRLIREFCQEENFNLRIISAIKLNAKQFHSEKLYWKRFYLKFTSYLYNRKNFFDNYTGSQIKLIKTFFNYLNCETTIHAGNFYKQFYVRKEAIAIFPLLPEELNFLIYDKDFEKSLSPRMQETKDVFVFGCTVALRVSDLLALKPQHIRTSNNRHYLSVRSQKTATQTLINLPDYCIEIYKKYSGKLIKRLLPKFNKSNLNAYIKQLIELAGFVQEVELVRERRGVMEVIRNTNNAEKKFRFCDVASTHTMRRTAITTMLCLGMPEQLVRKISGHAPASADFHRYVQWAQAYQDQEAQAVFLKLRETKSILLRA